LIHQTATYLITQIIFGISVVYFETYESTLPVPTGAGLPYTGGKLPYGRIQYQR